MFTGIIQVPYSNQWEIIQQEGRWYYMQKFSMTCTCGQVFSVDASNKDEAIVKMKQIMTEDAVKAHWAEKHEGQPLPTAEETVKMFGMLAPAM